MENNNTQLHDKMWQHWEKKQRRGKTIGGFLVVIIGSLFLARELGVVFPPWLFTWKVLLIAIGLVHLFKHGFSRFGWIIPIAIGSVFLLLDFYPDMAIKPLIWPILIILLGLFIIFKPRRKHNRMYWEKWQSRRQGWYKDHHGWHKHQDEAFQCVGSETSTNDDTIESVTIMSGIKKNVLTKNFKGGEITVVFGGAKIDFSQSDIQGKIRLEVNQIFGGTQLIIPANWQIQSQVVCVLGSVEDKRPMQANINEDENKKILILEGNIILGGLEIKSF